MDFLSVREREIICSIVTRVVCESPELLKAYGLDGTNWLYLFSLWLMVSLFLPCGIE